MSKLSNFKFDGNYTIIANELHKLKRKLNSYKRIIDTKEQCVDNNIDANVVDWNNLTNCIDMYRYLKNMLSWKFNTEMTSRDWIKFYEILFNENIIDKNVKEIKSFHISKAPGAFISAIIPNLI